MPWRWQLVRKLALLLLLLPGLAFAQVPLAAWQYRVELTQSAWRTFGPNAPIATLAAQIHQESGWNCAAVSWAGAQGCGQFMPKTAAYIATLHPKECMPANPFNAAWDIRCSQLYLRQQINLSRTLGTTECDAMAFGLRAYNGGLGWVRKDRALAAANGRNPDNWQAVAPFNAGRRHSAWRENTEYPVRIFRLEPRYSEWGRRLACVE